MDGEPADVDLQLLNSQSQYNDSTDRLSLVVIFRFRNHRKIAQIRQLLQY